MIRKPSAIRAAAVALELAQRMRNYYRDITFGNIPRTYAMLPGPGEEFIEYIPAPSCGMDSVPETHTCTFYLCCR